MKQTWQFLRPLQLTNDSTIANSINFGDEVNNDSTSSDQVSNNQDYLVEEIENLVSFI